MRGQTMAIASKSARLTYSDLCRLPDDGMRHELIDGEHYVSPSPRPKHQRAAGNLHGHLFMFLRQHPLGRAYLAPLDVVFSEINCVVPDLLYLSREREARQMTERNLEGAPDLVVEVLSPSTKHIDQGAKLRLYGRFGVPEYWVIDPSNEVVRIYRQENDELVRRAELSRGDDPSRAILSTPLLTGFELSLDEIFD
ncbi:MAG TPA: Uma2 family endonuclease [Thermoanaerobaculia bacterium]|nr:Uma2 family endonuclease [Thermoanaerobaculia bacterium]